jgi:hypothetical protein
MEKETTLSIQEKTTIGQRVSAGLVIGLGAAFLASYLAAGFFWFTSSEFPPVQNKVLIRPLGEGGGGAPLMSTGYIGRAPLYYCLQAEGGALHTVHDFNLGSNEHEVRGVWTIPGNIRWRDVVKVSVFLDVNDDEWNSSGSCDPVGDTAECANNPNSSEFSVTLKQNINATDNTIYAGGFCRFGNPGCENSLQTARLNDWYNDSCQDSSLGGDDDQYFMAAVVTNNTATPDSPDATLKEVRVKVCDDRDGDMDNNVDARVVIYRRESCNVIAEVVQPVSSGAQNKAWAVRTQTGSAYTLPDYNLRYGNDLSPFGGVLGVSTSTPPSLWPASVVDSNYLTGVSAMEPRPDGTNTRTGTPLTSRNATFGSKYCFDPARNQPCDNAECASVIACPDQTGVAACNARNAYSYCVGRPLQRCTGNATIACNDNADCAAVGAGTCEAAGTQVGAGQNLEYAATHLRQLFAKSYACYQLRSQIVSLGMRSVLQSSYGDCDSATAALTTWDVLSQANPYCAGNVRPTSPWTAGFCAVRPTINNFRINGQTGNVTVTVGSAVTGTFGYTEDAEQSPLKSATILWNWDGQNAEQACQASALSYTEDTGTYSESHLYSAVGTYHVLACVKDNWQASGYSAYGGTITVRNTGGGSPSIMKTAPSDQAGQNL